MFYNLVDLTFTVWCARFCTYFEIEETTKYCKVIGEYYYFFFFAEASATLRCAAIFF